jgi:hypothetical protein
VCADVKRELKAGVMDPQRALHLLSCAGADDNTQCGSGPICTGWKSCLWTGIMVVTTIGSIALDVVLLAAPLAEGPADLAELAVLRAEATEAEEAAAEEEAALAAETPAAATPGCRNSFTPDTPVLMADGSTKTIAEIRVGDLVLATDPATGKTKAEKVTALHNNRDHAFADLTVGAPGSTAVIHTTAEHRFWDESSRTWIVAAALPVGDTLHTPSGAAVPVADVRTFAGLHHMRNLTVAEIHTYYVLAGTTPVLVHNSCGNAMSSAIGEDSFLTKAAQQAGRNQRVQQEMDGLFKQLSEGNMNPGLGSKSLAGTDVSYARGRNGARLFFRNVDGGVQIVGKADKGNEAAVIKRLTGVYGQ